MGLKELLFPAKCVLCGTVLGTEETDLCRACRENAPEAPPWGRKISFVDKWTCLWYYKGNARACLLRYKFRGRRSYALPYGRLLAMKLTQVRLTDFDVLTWVPTGRRRRWERGFDQVELIAKALAAELGTRAVPCLKKIHRTARQASLHGEAARRANVMGAYRVIAPELVRGKRILLIDDIITTGATVTECAKTLLVVGAQEIYCASVAGGQEKK